MRHRCPLGAQFKRDVHSFVHQTLPQHRESMQVCTSFSDCRTVCRCISLPRSLSTYRSIHPSIDPSIYSVCQSLPPSLRMLNFRQFIRTIHLPSSSGQDFSQVMYCAPCLAVSITIPIPCDNLLFRALLESHCPSCVPLNKALHFALAAFLFRFFFLADTLAFIVLLSQQGSG